MSDAKQLSELRIELDKLATEAGLRLWHPGLEILIEGEEQGWGAPRPPELRDPESKLRRVYAQIVAPRKRMHAQEP